MHISPGPFTMPRSGIREIADLAWDRPDIIRLEMGEPDFETPAHVVEAAARAGRDGHTHYAPNAGVLALREALADKIERVNALKVSPGNIVVTNGAVQGLFAVLSCLVSRGDEVLVPDPGWPNYRMMVAILGGTSVGYQLDRAVAFEPDLELLERAITPRTRVLLINNPSNPLGSIMSESSMRSLLELARRHDLWVISDECYDQIVFDGPLTSIATMEDRPERVITTWSFSKTYAMTGWRVGYTHAPDELIPTLCKVQEPLIACVNTPAQHAAIAALTGSQEFVPRAVTAYRRRSDLVADILRTSGLATLRPRGAFYAWVPLDASQDGLDVARRLVSQHGVAVAPGPTFGPAGRHAVRLSLATSEENLREGLYRAVDSGLITPPLTAGGTKGQAGPGETQRLHTAIAGLHH